MVRWPQSTLVDVADFSGLAAHAQDLGEFFNLLKMEGVGATAEWILRTRLVVSERRNDATRWETKVGPEKKRCCGR